MLIKIDQGSNSCVSDCSGNPKDWSEKRGRYRKNLHSHNKSEAPKLLNQPIYVTYKTSLGIKKPTKGVGFHLEKNLLFKSELSYLETTWKVTRRLIASFSSKPEIGFADPEAFVTILSAGIPCFTRASLTASERICE